MKIITIGTLKGGTGKTTTTFNLAGCLAEFYKVLLIDCDPQANLSQDCGLDITDQSANSIKSVFDAYLAPYKTVIKSPIKELPNLDLLPSNIWLMETEMMLVNRAGRESILANYFEDNKDFFSQYDYVICDTNPSMSIINQNAFYLADSIILVSDVSMNGLTGIELFDYLWSKAARDLRKKKNIEALILNNADNRTKILKELVEYCEQNEDLNKWFVKPVISQSVKIKETSLEHKPINLYLKNSRECSAYVELINNLKEKGVISIPAKEVNSELEQFLVLKHDIENSVQKAYKLAEIEKKYGHRGTFYTQAYLLNTPDNVDLLLKMQKMGHEISYHYDVMDSNHGNIERALKEFEENRKKFEAYGFRLETVCQHGNPIVERVGYTSNRDFFRNKKVQEKYSDMTDIMVNFQSKYEVEYKYYSDAGREFNLIHDPINNDVIKSDDKNIPYEDIDRLFDAILQEHKVIISTHPHRWTKSMMEYIVKEKLFKAIRTVAKLLIKIPLFRRVMSKYYYLAKRI